MNFSFNGRLVGLACAAVLLLWLGSGFYTVNERENGVETLLGKYKATTKSGLNWNFPAPLGKVEKIDVQSITTMRVGEFKTQKGSISTKDQRVGQMLTKDENIVEIGAAVQYRISDARAFQFNAADPVEVLRDVVTSAIREVVGANTVDDVLTNRRNEWPQQARKIIIDTSVKYDLGIEIVALELQDARVPVEVQDAFEDAVRAREDEERLRLEAEAFANERLPMARGDAEQRLQAARAYSATLLARSRGEATRFNDLLTAYRKDEEALKARLYIDTMNEVYARSRKIIADESVRPVITLDGGKFTAPLIEQAVLDREHAPADTQMATANNIGKNISVKTPAEKTQTDDLRERARDRSR